MLVLSKIPVPQPLIPILLKTKTMVNIGRLLMVTSSHCKNKLKLEQEAKKLEEIEESIITTTIECRKMSKIRLEHKFLAVFSI